jgi:endonuclease-3
MTSATLEIVALLKKNYPRPRIALTYKNPWELLVATILSAQCTDKRVNIVTPGLFKRFASVEKTAGARQKDFEELIRSTGFYRNKAKNII